MTMLKGIRYDTGPWLRRIINRELQGKRQFGDGVNVPLVMTCNLLWNGGKTNAILDVCFDSIPKNITDQLDDTTPICGRTTNTNGLDVYTITTFRSGTVSDFISRLRQTGRSGNNISDKSVVIRGVESTNFTIGELKDLFWCNVKIEHVTVGYAPYVNTRNLWGSTLPQRRQQESSSSSQGEESEVPFEEGINTNNKPSRRISRGSTFKFF